MLEQGVLSNFPYRREAGRKHTMPDSRQEVSNGRREADRNKQWKKWKLVGSK